MLGIPGFDPLGAVHATFGLLAIALGAPVVLMAKGTPAHRRVGLLYAAAMVALNVTAFLLYDLFGRFGPFHALALVSLASVADGVQCAWRRQPRHRWLERHARAMNWSYAGLVAAFFSEIGARLPGVSLLDGVLVPTFTVCLVAAWLIETRGMRAAAAQRSRMGAQV